MKICEVYKCRRQALGWTKAKLAEKAKIKIEVIERYENEEKISYPFEKIIKDTIDSEFSSIDSITHYKKRTLELALQIQKEQETEWLLHDIGHMMVELGKLQMEVMREIL